MKIIQCPKCEADDIIAVLKQATSYGVEGIDKDGDLRLCKLIKELNESKFQCLECGHTWKTSAEPLVKTMSLGEEAPR